MKRRACAGLLSVLLVMSLFFAAAASGGSSSDPVVSKSYVDGTFTENLLKSAQSKIESAISSFKSKYISRAENSVNVSISGDAAVEACAEATLRYLQNSGRYLYSTKSMSPRVLKSGDVISGRPGTMIMVLEGSGKCTSGSVINITRGSEVFSGNALGRFTSFMFPENGGRIEITSTSAKVLVDGVFSCTSGGYTPKYTDEAYALKKLGLVRGAANGMELYRGNTRAESITMLIRLLGEEESALMMAHSHPFTDVDTWAQRYVGYAYRMGYTKGVSNTRYDGSAMTTATQYMTFILRSLGYSEEAGDFKYLTALSDAVSLGVIPASVKAEIEAGEFRRDQVMYISYLAMSARVKGSSSTLLAKLVANGAVDAADAKEFLNR